MLLNIGGIANITYIPAGANIDQVIAFDTGPGNCVSDYLCRKYDPTGCGFDAEGKLARAGEVDQRLLPELRKAAYFNKLPPKSTDGPEMIELFENAVDVLSRNSAKPNSLKHLLAGACEFTISSILWAISRYPAPAEVIVSGGGTKNTVLMRGLTDGITGLQMETKLADALGVPSDAKEAIAFALLGAATLEGFPSNVPSVTGAKRAVVLGSITPKP